MLLAILKSSGGGPYLQNYLDDFLIISPPTPYLCQSQLSQCLRVCHLLGIPIAPDKTEGPSTSLTYLGFLFDTVKMELQLPPSKLAKVRSALSLWSNRKRWPKRELLSLVGLLQHACQAIPHGRPFLRRLIDRAYSVKELHHFVRLSPWECDDVNFWFTLLLDWNGKCLFLLSAQDLAPTHSISSDAAGGLGFAAIYKGAWFAGPWPPSSSSLNIATKELIPIVLAAYVWGSQWSRKRVLFKCDSMAVVDTLRKGACRDRHLAYLLRELTLLAIRHSFSFFATHIPGVRNTHADALSRFNLQVFKAAVPDADPNPTVIPQAFLLHLLFPPWMHSGKH